MEEITCDKCGKRFIGEGDFDFNLNQRFGICEECFEEEDKD